MCLNIVEQHIRKEAANYDRRGALLHTKTQAKHIFIALLVFALLIRAYWETQTESALKIVNGVFCLVPPLKKVLSKGFTNG